MSTPIHAAPPDARPEGSAPGRADPSGGGHSGELLALRDRTQLATAPDNRLWLLCWPRSECLGPATERHRSILRRLAAGPVTLDELTATAAEASVPATAATAATADGTTEEDSEHADAGESDANADPDSADLDVAEFVGRLRAGGWVNVTVTAGDRPIYTVVPWDAWPQLPSAPAAGLRLSRFTVLRREDEDFVVESPRGRADIRIHDPDAVGELGNLNGGGDRDHRRSADISGPPGEVAARLREDLLRSGLAIDETDTEDTELRSRQWGPHELWFHERSRLRPKRDFGAGYGRTLWGKRASFAPVPVRPEPYDSPPIPLDRPDLDELRRNEPSFTAILEDRHTARRHDDENPLTTATLGAFLYRCGRVRGTLDWDGVTYVSKPYPNGGSVGELEIYPVVRLMGDLDPGMYHYDAFDHALRAVCPGEHPAVRRLLRTAVRSSLSQEPPQILLLITSRVGRQMWAYENMGYSLTLKHAGVLYQTMYLVAQAMGLAVCGLGGGDGEAFNLASGRDPLEECGVGELMLGSPGPPEVPPPGIPPLATSSWTPPTPLADLADGQGTSPGAAPDEVPGEVSRRASGRETSDGEAS